MIDLFPFQRETVSRITKFGGRSLLALDMGLGKTICSLSWALARPERQPVLVICPASVKYNWEREALIVGLRAAICESKTPPETNGHFSEILSPVMIINYDILKGWQNYLDRIKFKTLILDECQYVANQKAQRTKLCRHFARRIPYFLALSGTPLMNRPAELFPTLNMLRPSVYPSFWSFASDHCSPRKQRYGWTFKGATNLDELHAKLNQVGMIRYRKADVLNDLPDKIRSVRLVEMSHPEEYQRASSDFLNWLKSKAGAWKAKKAARAETITRMGHLIRLTAKLKLRGVVEHINDQLEESDEKFILFAVHRKCIEALQRQIKAQSVIVDGSVTGRKRQMAVDEFQKNPRTRVFIGNLQAAGVGITLTAATNVKFIELGWRPADHLQAEDRPHRIGQKKTVFVDYYVARGTIEEDRCEILQRKQEIISSVLDGGPTNSDLDVFEELVKRMEGRLL